MCDSIKSIYWILSFTFLSLGFILSGCRDQASLEDLSTSPVINPPLDLPETIDQYPELNQNLKIETEYIPVSENSVLRLYVNLNSSAIIIEDLRSGTLWRSSPEDLDTHEGTTNIWRSLIEMPIQVSYVDAARAQRKNVKPEEVLNALEEL